MIEKEAYLDELLKNVEVLFKSGDLHVKVTGIHMDSRKIKPDNCFIAIRGFKENGVKYMGDAISKGANSIVFETSPDDTFPDIPFTMSWVQVKNARLAMSRMAAAFYNRVSDSMYSVGITGTNGKTTVMSLIHAIFSREAKTAKIGTLGMFCEGLAEKTGLTTPESVDLFKFLSEAHEIGCKNLVMEVSSVSLNLNRVANIRFSQGVFTSFSGDHLDFHITMEDYFESKMTLFKNLKMEDWAVVNIDDPIAGKVLEQLDCKYLTYGFSEHADVRPLKYKLSLDGIHASIQTPKGKIDIKSHMVGRVNLSNIMAAVTSAVIKGVSFENIAGALNEIQPVKGRLDMVVKDKFFVLIDYAHTDKALEALLQSLREIAPQKIIVVFGAGGARDKTKRPRMGKVTGQNADFVVITSDNPRTENPMDIINDITQGFDEGFDRYVIEPDRKNAIERAMRMAGTGDLVVVAGKGHEDYQVFKDKTIHFDDYEVVQDVFKRIKKEENA